MKFRNATKFESIVTISFVIGATFGIILCLLVGFTFEAFSAIMAVFYGVVIGIIAMFVYSYWNLKRLKGEPI